MTEPVLQVLGGNLSPGNHHFSIVVYRSHNNEERYYELKPKYHGQHPSSKFFKVLWDWFVRPTHNVSAAVIWRAKKVLARSNIAPLESKYMTTAVMSSTKTRPSRFRHVVGVKLTDGDFQSLKQSGMLRELYRGDASKKDHIRDTILGISPLAARVKVSL